MKIKTAIIISISALLVLMINMLLINNYTENKYSIEATTKDNQLANNTLSSTTTSLATETLTTATSTTTTISTTTTTKVTTTVTTTTTPLLSIGDEVVYDGLTLSELTEKLNKNLYDTLSNSGIYFADYTVKTGLDPYLAVSIVLVETGCKWGCSSLVKTCYNIGGIKGSPSCNGGSYKKYDSLEAGIDGYLDLLYNNYYSKGLTTAEAINTKYASSLTWSEKVNTYYETIKNS